MHAAIASTAGWIGWPNGRRRSGMSARRAAWTGSAIASTPDSTESERAERPVLIDATETLRQPPAPAPSTAAAAVESLPVDIDGFLASVERRAFRLAELALGDREDALDAVQDAMIKLVRYRGRPAGDWSPLF